MSSIRNLIVVALFVSILCVGSANAAENTSEPVLAPSAAAASHQSAEVSFDVIGWLIRQFSDAVPTKESGVSAQRGLKAPPLT